MYKIIHIPTGDPVWIQLCIGYPSFISRTYSEARIAPAKNSNINHLKEILSNKYFYAAYGSLIVACLKQDGHVYGHNQRYTKVRRHELEIIEEI